MHLYISKTIANLYSLVIFGEWIRKHLSVKTVGTGVEKKKKKLCFQEAKIINILCTCRDVKTFLMDFFGDLLQHTKAILYDQ